MPFDGSAGHGPWSEIKQRHLRLILSYHLSSTYGGVMRKGCREGWPMHPYYLYWDLYAGPGRYEDGMVGSPLVALEEAAARYVPIHAGLFESDPRTAQRLRGVLGEARTHYPDFDGRFRVIVGDNTETVPAVLAQAGQHVKARAYGLVYADPNPDRDNGWVSLLRQISQTHNLGKLDFLVHVSATNYKRVRGASTANAPYLEDHLRMLGKPHLWIREPIAQQQWTFVLASEWPKLPVPKRLNFRCYDSDEGRALVDRLNISQRERDGRTA